MSTPTKPVAAPAGIAPSNNVKGTAGLERLDLLHEQTERRVDEIEMIGEEEASGLLPAAHSEVTVGMRYLHCSRTIHQLVTDRNRAVGIYLAVASLLWTGTGAVLNARPNPSHLVPIELIQRWCMPVTFGRWRSWRCSWDFCSSARASA